MNIVLRPDQAKLKSDIYNSWGSGSKATLAVLPTGGGKSVIVSDIALDIELARLNQCIIAHRVELVGQMSLHIGRRGIKHRIIAPDKVISEIRNEHRREFDGRIFVKDDAACAIGGVDTLISRKAMLHQWSQQIAHVTFDEAHHVLKKNKWGEAFDMFPNARGLGVTASPSRADGMGLGFDFDGIFNEMVQGPTMRELINIGALTPYEIAIPDSDFVIDETSLPPSGDFTIKKMREASKKSHIVGDVVKEYIRRAYGKRGICFATDVETAGEIAQNFNNAGIPAVAVSAETPGETRAEYIRRFRNGQIWMMVNVDLFGEGFDLPAIEVVIMARPTASLAVYLQQFGRALRTLLGKSHGLIIDHVSNWKRHGFPDKPHRWTLARAEKKSGKKTKDPEDIPLIRCSGPECGKLFEKVKTCCPYCATPVQIAETGGGRATPEQVDGDLILLDAETIARMQAAIQLEHPEHLAQRAAFAAGKYAGIHRERTQADRIAAQQALIDAMALFSGQQKARGRTDDRENMKRFYHMAGIDVLSALALPKAEMEILTRDVLEWVQK